MSSSRSEDRLRTLVPLTALAVAAATLAFHALQNRYALTGGGAAWPKSIWLGCAVLFWFVLPACLVMDARLPLAWRRLFTALLWLMAMRAVVELWMLYVSHNWSPFYGIAHDVICVVAVLSLAGVAARVTVGRSENRLARVVFVHALATALLFVPEIYFAWYMQANFQTQGEHPTYFVPDAAAHAPVLRITMAADLAAIVYLVPFLRAWLRRKA